MDKLEELRQRYWRSLPRKAEDLQGQWQRVQLQPQERTFLAELHMQVHRLSGSAPAYGFDTIGALARPIDQQLALWLHGEDAELPPDAVAMMAALVGPVVTLIDALRNAADQELPPL
ncbi:MAG: Hpt domain-containing protein [Rhodanobacteraceae bacterium]|nr:Hpt domain-containing protein [Rhodanobacteraceae bacterium]